jgi:gliding motility-associated-like protein
LALSSNYVLNYTTASLTIGKAALSIIAEDKEKFTGTANPTFTVKYTGLVNGETGGILTTPATLSTTATTNSPIGTYTIVPSGAVAANYQISYVNGILTVKPGAPTNVLFAATTLYENRASGTAAGTLSSTSDDPNATFAYSLVSGTGDTDNALFSISGNRLLTAATLDYENKTTYSVRLRSTTQYGFSLDKTFTIALSDVNELPTLAAIANQNICYTTIAQNINLTGISAGPETGQSTSISVAGNNSALLQNLTVSGSGATAIINYSIKTGASGTATVTVTVKDNGGIDNGGVDIFSRTFVITVNALPIVAINSDKGTQISKGEIVTLSATGGVSYAWVANGSIQSGLNLATIKVRPLATTTYSVTVTNASGCAETQTFTITVLDDMAKVKATNIMSPNGDGYNDKWLIDNIDVYPNNEVKIFDRSGRLIFSKKGYDNSWDGTLNGLPLAEGTYFYIIDFGPARPKVKGFITITKSN